MDLTIIIILYFIGYAFSYGAFCTLWAEYGVKGEVFMLLAMLLWPVIWAFYLPYKFASWVFK